MEATRRVRMTTRGLALAGVGTGITAAGVLLGVRTLTQVGLLLLGVVAYGLVVLHAQARSASRGGLRLVRRVTPHPVTVGDDALVEVEVTSAGGVHRLDRLEVGEQAARELSGTGGLRARVHRTRGRLLLTYPIQPAHRGRWSVGPLQVQRADVFGVARWSGPLGEPMRVAVRPRVYRLDMDTRSASTDVDRAAIGTRMPAADDASLRDYRPGDDLRRVHWRSTAHRGTLMVRREEQPVRAHCTILLDTRRVAYAGAGPGSPFERAVSGAASAVRHLVERDYVVRLVTETGLQLPGPETHASGGEVLDLIMDALALIDHSAETGLDGAGTALRGADSGLIVAFLGAVDRTQNEVLGRLRQRATGSVAFVAAGQVDPGLEATRLERLRASGWTALPLQPGVPLGQLWQQAAQELAVRGGGRS